MQPILPIHLAARILLILLLALAGYFFRGFLVPVLAALIIGFASWPIYQRWLKICGNRNTLAASTALAIIVVVLIVPIGFALSYSIKEARNVFTWLMAANKGGMSVPDWIRDLPFAGDKLTAYWNEYLAEPRALSALIETFSGEHLGNIYRLVLAASGDLFQSSLALLFLLITLLFVYRDGPKIVGQLDLIGDRIFPDRWHRFSRVVPNTISSTVTGMGLIAIGEGVVLGVAYWVAGVPSHVLLGVITGFMAMVPGGAPLCFTLISIYLAGSGHVVAGASLFAWGTIELFIVDKTIRPKLVGGPVKLPFLPTFFGLIGGLKTLGVVGLFIGPVLMALLVAIWREWVLEIKEQTPVSAPD